MIVDLVDPSTRQLLWRGLGVAQVSENPNKYANESGKVIAKIVKKLPEAHS